LIISLLVFEFIAVGRYAEYPWWHHLYEVNDTDATHAGQTLVLLNGHRVYMIVHPAATIYTIHSLAYRIRALADRRFRQILNLEAIGNLEQAAHAMDVVTRFSRQINFATVLVFGVLFSILLLQLTGRVSVTVLLAFYVLLSPAFLRHTPVVRPEILSLLFLVTAMNIGVRMLERPAGSCPGRMIFYCSCGILLGCAVFSKVQVLPLVAVYMVGMSVLLYFRPEEETGLRYPYRHQILIGIGLVNLLIFPWWALTRPAFLTPAAIQDLNVHLKKLYGPCPSGFHGPVLAALIFLLGLGVLLVWLNRRQDKRLTCMKKLTPVFLFVNTALTGGIVSLYLFYLPASVNLKHYVANTQNTVYAVLTNMVYRGFMMNKTFNFDAFRDTAWIMHERNTSLFHIHIAIIVGVAALAALVRLVLKSTSRRMDYALVLLFFALGVGMDALASLRWLKVVQDNYAVYSMCFYVLGLGCWISLEWAAGGRIRNYVFRGLVIGLLVAHMAVTTHWLLIKPKASGKSDQGPLLEYQNNSYWVPDFWSYARPR